MNTLIFFGHQTTASGSDDVRLWWLALWVVVWIGVCATAIWLLSRALLRVAPTKPAKTTASRKKSKKA